jgi:hypothetical protein
MHLLIAIGFGLWWVSGVASFCFWWTREYDLTLSRLWDAACIGVSGPIAFVVGWLIFGPPSNRPSIVLIRSRKHRATGCQNASSR